MFYPARRWWVLGVVLGLALLAACDSTPPVASNVPAGTSSPPAHSAPARTRTTAGSPAAAATVSPSPASTPAATHVEPGVVYTIPGMDQVRVRPDLTYQTDNAGNLKMDVYSPRDLPTRAALPAVLFVHGGPVPPSVSVKDSALYRSWGKLLAAAGLTAVTANWRVGVPADIDALIEHVRGEAGTLQIDRQRLCLFGMSAGVAPIIDKALDSHPDYLRCIVAYYGTVTDAWFRLRRLKGVPPRLPPILVAQGAKDDRVPLEGAEQFIKLLRTKGGHAELLIHPTGGHFFEAFNDDDRSREIVKRTIAFLQEQLTPR